MISSVADEQEENEEIQNSCDSPTGHEQTRMIKDKYDFTNVEKETKVIKFFYMQLFFVCSRTWI